MKQYLQNKTIKITTDYKTISQKHLSLKDPLSWHLKKTKGLMHEKILVVDETTTYLGSANMTYESLTMHENLIVGIYDETFAKELQKETFGTKKFTIQDQELIFFRMPYKGAGPISHILNLINQSEKSIQIAMFTFTHKDLIEALIKAYKRGIKLNLYIDRTSSRGASKNAIEALIKEGISVKINTGQQLLHHKMMLIDQKTLVLGSTNWTKSAFKKNQDFFLSLTPLSSSQQKMLKKIFKNLNPSTIYYK